MPQRDSIEQSALMSLSLHLQEHLQTQKGTQSWSPPNQLNQSSSSKTSLQRWTGDWFAKCCLQGYTVTHASVRGFRSNTSATRLDHNHADCCGHSNYDLFWVCRNNKSAASLGEICQVFGSGARLQSKAPSEKGKPRAMAINVQ